MKSTAASDPELRRSRVLVVTFRSDTFEVSNFLQRHTFFCNQDCLDFLASAPEWQPASVLCKALKSYRAPSVAKTLIQLIEMGALLVRGSPEATTEEVYEKEWEWGIPAGLYHFGLKDSPYLSEKQAARHIKLRARMRPSPTLFQKNGPVPPSLELPRVKQADDVLSAMMRRRTIRGFTRAPITRAELSECLFAGLGIIGIHDDREMGRLPLKLTPSGGARNPYEAFVYCLNVEGVARGIYHYSALESSLAPVGGKPPPLPSRFLSNQLWIDKAAAVVLLVTHLDRTMWKYNHPLAYRAVLIEAGHIAQNIAVMAATRGLTANPTAAIQDSIAEAALGIRSPMESVVYALSLGRPDWKRNPLGRRQVRPASSF